MSIVESIKNAFSASRMGQLVSDKLLSDLGDDEQKRVEAINTRWQAYKGNGPKPLKVKTGDTDDNIRLNFAGRIVDTGASFLFGKDIDFVVDKAEAVEGEEKQSGPDDWLEAVWDANNGMTLLLELAISGGVAGDAYFRVLPPDAEENGHEYPRIVLVDSGSIRAVWDTHDYKKVLQWIIQWNAIDPDTNKPIALRQVFTRRAGTWEIKDQSCPEGSREWVTDDTHSFPYAWSPIFHAQNLPIPNEFYGMSDLEDDVLEAGGGVNFIASNTGRIIRFHAHPKTWGYGINAKEIKIGVDEALVFSNEKAHLENLEMQSDLTACDVHYHNLKEAFHEIARTPEITTGNMENVGQLSGLALKVLYGPLLQKNGVKQRLYGDMLRDLSQRLLEMGGKGKHKVTITWPDPLPSDPVADGTALETDQRLGASSETLLEKRGYDAKTEMKRKAVETKAAMAQENANGNTENKTGGTH